MRMISRALWKERVENRRGPSGRLHFGPAWQTLLLPPHVASSVQPEGLMVHTHVWVSAWQCSLTLSSPPPHTHTHTHTLSLSLSLALPLRVYLCQSLQHIVLVQEAFSCTVFKNKTIKQSEPHARARTPMHAHARNQQRVTCCIECREAKLCELVLRTEPRRWELKSKPPCICLCQATRVCLQD